MLLQIIANLLVQFLRQRHCTVCPVQGDESCLAVFTVAANGLAQLLRGAGNIQHIVHDLEHQPQPVCVGGQNLALLRCCTGCGMVYGQELDLKYEALAATEEQLRLIHRNKTGALINAAVQMGAAAAGATPQQCKILASYAYGLGLVFQIVDDVLDVTSTPEQLGKPIGSDSENGKTTFVTLYGVDGAMVLAQKLNEQICNDLQQHFGAKAAFLQQLAQQLLVRKN